MTGCAAPPPARNRADEQGLPRTILWAWERPEDLEFVDPQRIGVAFLAQTLTLQGNDVAYNPRLQPLKVSPNTMLIAVTRIESQKVTGGRPALSVEQRDRLVELVLKSRELKNVLAIQIDFDAAVSERDFYRSLLVDLRQRLPDNVPLSMTALASFCIGDRWIADLPVDEAVPMIFRMGADNKAVKGYLTKGGDFGEPLCQKSYGVAVDEPLTMKVDGARRLYVFNARPWTKEDLEAFEQRISK